MEAARKKAIEFFGRRENVINLFLVGSFAAISWRSHHQQKEIDDLEEEKSSLRIDNNVMSSTMWAWREHLFHLAEADPSSASISLARLSAIYGEDANSSPDADFHRDRPEVASENEPTIAIA